MFYYWLRRAMLDQAPNSRALLTRGKGDHATAARNTDVYHEIPPNSGMVLTRLEVIRPAGAPRTHSLDTCYPTRAVSVAGVAAREAISEPAHRGPGPSKGILRSSSGHTQQDSSASTPSPKSPRFAHMTTVHDELSPQDETQSVTRTLRPPGRLSKRSAASRPVRSSMRRSKENEAASAGLNQLMMDGPTGDTYTGASGSQTWMSWDADAVPPPPTGSDTDSPGASPSKFTRMEYRPPTPPLESDSAESSELIEQAEGDHEPDTFLPRTVESSSESPRGSPAREDWLAEASTAGDEVATGHEELPPPYSPAQLAQSSGDWEAGGPLTENELPVTASAQPSAGAFHESSGENQQSAQASSETANNPPLHVITTPRRGRGIAASRPIPLGEILVREDPLLDERHDSITGGTRRIRES